MAASITVHLQIFERPQLPHFSTDLDETGIKIKVLLRSFIQNIVIIRVAVPFNMLKIMGKKIFTILRIKCLCVHIMGI